MTKARIATLIKNMFIPTLFEGCNEKITTNGC